MAETCVVCARPAADGYCDKVCEGLDLAFPGIEPATGDGRYWSRPAIEAAGWGRPTAPTAKRGRTFKPKGQK